MDFEDALPGGGVEVCHPGREQIYGFLSAGNMVAADQLLEDIWELPRHPAVELENITWTENPFAEKYWRFIFYSLRHTSHLLWAYLETEDRRYRDKLIAILESFTDKGWRSPYLSDAHTSAFLVMVLVNTYWKLANRGELPPALARKIERVLKDRAGFLLDEQSFEGHNNHGVTEAAALYLVAVSFSGLEGAARWRQVGLARLRHMVLFFVDEDGVQTEQSTWYHFYTMNFFWQIYHWGHLHGVELPEELLERTQKMIEFAKHIVQPDGRIPMLGASQSLSIITGHPELYAELAAFDPELAYVRSQGTTGTMPLESDILFPDGGYAILRSGYTVSPDEQRPFHSARTYAEQAHVVMDVGPYRTAHSHYDALHVNLYAHGRLLLSDSGFFTLVRGPRYDYYHSTRAHNTVVVDGRDQSKGRAVPVSFLRGDGWAYHSAHHSLYDGVLHRRGVLRLGSDVVVVIDELASTRQPVASHAFAQTWNFPAHVELHAEADGADVYGPDMERVMRLHQALGATPSTYTAVRGQTEPLNGWYSERYDIDDPAWVLSYEQAGTEAHYVTVFLLGPLASAEVESQAVRTAQGYDLELCAPEQRARISIRGLASPAEEVSVLAAPAACEQGR